ncbi:hypothetical protein D3C85_712680 [compost metagenome]
MPIVSTDTRGDIGHRADRHRRRHGGRSNTRHRPGHRSVQHGGNLRWVAIYQEAHNLADARIFKQQRLADAKRGLGRQTSSQFGGNVDTGHRIQATLKQIVVHRRISYPAEAPNHLLHPLSQVVLKVDVRARRGRNRLDGRQGAGRHCPFTGKRRGERLGLGAEQILTQRGHR